MRMKSGERRKEEVREVKKRKETVEAWKAEQRQER
jgi:hypothetical protein